MSETTTFSQDVVRDESGTDWHLTKFEIKTACIINANYLAMLAPDLFVAGNPVTSNPADIMAVVQPRLMQHRRDLSFTFNGVELIPRPQQGLTGTVDAMNGPKPQSCTYTLLTNTTFLMTYYIIAHYWVNNKVNPRDQAAIHAALLSVDAAEDVLTLARETGDDFVIAAAEAALQAAKDRLDALGAPLVVNQPGNDVLYNRWSESVTIDEQNYTRRTREGKFIIRSDNADGKLADELRSQMAVVSVPDGFVRESARYTVDQSGLGLSYTIIDKEVFKQPPGKAFKAQGYYIESTPLLMGGVRFAEVVVTLWGDKSGDQSELASLAVRVASNKLDARGKQGQAFKAAIFKDASMRMQLYENKVEFRIKAMIGPDKARTFGQAGAIGGVRAFLHGVFGINVIQAVRGALGEGAAPNPGAGAGAAGVGAAAAAQRLPAPAPDNPLNSFVGMDASAPGSDDDSTPPSFLDRGTASLLLQAAAYYDPSLRDTKLGPGKPFGDNAKSVKESSHTQLTGTARKVGEAGKTKEP